MNVLFITLERIDDISGRGLYTDTLRKFVNSENHLTIISAFEHRDRSLHLESHTDGNVTYLYAFTWDILKNKNYIEKGIGTVLLGRQYLRTCIRAKIPQIDLLICTTPSITFEPLVRFIKNRDGSKTVLLLKDMWPYDLVFDGILTTNGIKGIVYKYFDRVAKRLFRLSDTIGCMTPKNKEFLEKVYCNGKELEKAIIIPNSIEPLEYALSKEEKRTQKIQRGLPEDKTIFVYGGNLGVAQGVDFIISSIEYVLQNRNDVFFLIYGNGTERQKLSEAFIDSTCVRVDKALSRDEYEKIVYLCDVGLVYLNWNCHTPNSPSRILQYMQASLPVICATDDTTDIGDICEDYGFGLKCPSNDEDLFLQRVSRLTNGKIREEMGRKGREVLESHFSADKTYSLIMDVLTDMEKVL